MDLNLQPIGYVVSPIINREEAPNQGDEGAPDAWIIVDRNLVEGLDGIQPGQEIIIFTWLHRSKRNILKLHPQWNNKNPLTGVFATCSPDRPNPIGMHPTTVLEIIENKLKVTSLEAVNGTPVIDIKPMVYRKMIKTVHTG